MKNSEQTTWRTYSTRRVHGRVKRYRNKGIVALITVIIISAVIMLIGISAAYMAQTEVILSGDADLGRHALSLASACGEEALFRLKLDTAYTGGTIPLDSYDCTVTVTGTGSTRVIVVSATSSVYTKTVQIDVTLRQNAASQAKAWRIDAWQELDP